MFDLFVSAAVYKVGMASSNIMPAALNVGSGGGHGGYGGGHAAMSASAVGSPGFMSHAYFSSFQKRPAPLSVVQAMMGPPMAPMAESFDSLSDNLQVTTPIDQVVVFEGKVQMCFFLSNKNLVVLMKVQ